MIYLVRHGQTRFNAEQRMQGHLDSPLTDLGHAQAKAMADRLRREITDPAGWRLVVSPLGRTQATAAYIAEALGLTVELEPRIMELNCGGFEGRLRAEVIAGVPEADRGAGFYFHGPQAESYEALDARVGSWLGDLPPEPRRRVIAVSHGVSGRLIRGRYLGLAREAAVALEAPQDSVFRLSAGAVEKLAC
jgi:broad specificity phosphatase PhoE